MKCIGCFKEFKGDEAAYATVVWGVEKDLLMDDDRNFYADDIEAGLSLLCKDCGMAVHDFIAYKLQMKHLHKAGKFFEEE
jgi:hypothetical protein